MVKYYKVVESVVVADTYAVSCYEEEEVYDLLDLNTHVRRDSIETVVEDVQEISYDEFVALQGES